VANGAGTVTPPTGFVLDQQTGSQQAITPPSGFVLESSGSAPDMDQQLHAAYDNRPLWRKVLGMEPDPGSMSPELSQHLANQKQAATQTMVRRLQQTYAPGTFTQSGNQLQQIARIPDPVQRAQAFRQALSQDIKPFARSAEMSVPGTGAGLYDVAQSAAYPAVNLATQTIEAVPSTARAGQAIENVTNAVGNAAVDVNAPGQSALRIQELGTRGSQRPKVIKDFLARTTDPNQPPLGFQEARDFYTAATRMSKNQYNKLAPPVKKVLGEFVGNLHNSLTDTAETTAGMGSEYENAITEYARASKIGRALDVAKKIGIGAALTGAGSRGLYDIYQAFRR